MSFFITFEGIEGSGKSTQLKLLEAHLKEKGARVLSVREPGGTLLGESVRDLLVNEITEAIDARAELLLYEACRAQIVSHVIKPALKEGKVVLCDRFVDSTSAYQGGGREIEAEPIELINNWASYGLTPELTILVDCPPELGIKRALERIEGMDEGESKEDRFEKEAMSFHTRVREAYLSLAKRFPDRIKVVDGDAAKEDVQKEVIRVVSEGMKNVL